VGDLALGDFALGVFSWWAISPSGRFLLLSLLLRSLPAENRCCTTQHQYPTKTSEKVIEGKNYRLFYGKRQNFHSKNINKNFKTYDI